MCSTKLVYAVDAEAQGIIFVRVASLSTQIKVLHVCHLMLCAPVICA
jgi:hypothetical protein